MNHIYVLLYILCILASLSEILLAYLEYKTEKENENKIYVGVIIRLVFGFLFFAIPLFQVL